MISLFQNEFEAIAIERIKKFAKIAMAMNLEISLGFSGGKDSQVCYDLCKRSGVNFKAYFNHCFESNITLNFIKTHYPDVIWRRDHNFGFIQNIIVNYNGYLPTVQSAYCCSDYKHNRKYVDACSIVGVRKEESFKRKQRTAFEAKNKTTMKKNKILFDEYFEEHCQSTGSSSIIQLKPIIDWTSNEIWNYIHTHNLPINPEYNYRNRVGCIVCPKANLMSNHIGLIQMPKLIDCFIRARECNPKYDWFIKSDNTDYSNDKVYYICRWLNHSFMPFNKTQEAIYLKIRENYDKYKARNSR